MFYGQVSIRVICQVMILFLDCVFFLGICQTEWQSAVEARLPLAQHLIALVLADCCCRLLMICVCVAIFLKMVWHFVCVYPVIKHGLELFRGMNLCMHCAVLLDYGFMFMCILFILVLNQETRLLPARYVFLCIIMLVINIYKDIYVDFK